MVSIISLTVPSETYRSRHPEVKEVYACNATNQDGDRCRKVLGDIIGIVDDERDHNATSCLKTDSRPHHPVVADEESSLGYDLPILPYHTKEQRRKERPETELAVADPERRLLGAR